MEKLGIDPTQTTVSLTNANTEYSYTVPDKTVRLVFRLRNAFDISYGWATGERVFTLPAGSFRDISDVILTTKVLYFSCAEAGQTVEVEYFLGQF